MDRPRPIDSKRSLAIEWVKYWKNQSRVNGDEKRVHSSTKRPRNRITSDEIRGIRYQNGGIGNNLGSNSETDEFSRARHTNSGLDTHTVVPQEETTHHEHIITGHRQRPASPTRNQRIGNDPHQKLTKELLRGRIKNHPKWPADHEVIQSLPDHAVH